MCCYNIENGYNWSWKKYELEDIRINIETS